jgi:hypothetical protein
LLWLSQRYVQQVTVQAHHQVGIKFKTEEQKRADKAKKDAKEREDLEMRLLFAQLQGGAGKAKAKMEAAAREVSATCGVDNLPRGL